MLNAIIFGLGFIALGAIVAAVIDYRARLRLSEQLRTRGLL